MSIYDFFAQSGKMGTLDMKNIVIIVLLSLDLLCVGIMIICFFLLYWEMIKQCKMIKNDYKASITVKCISIDQKEMNRNDVNRAEGYGGNNRVHYKVCRPYFEGNLNGKQYTFVRTNDIHQPSCEVGKNYTIFLRNLNKVDCRDFYESNEILEMNTFMQKKKKQYLAIISICIMIAVVLLFV